MPSIAPNTPPQPTDPHAEYRQSVARMNRDELLVEFARVNKNWTEAAVASCTGMVGLMFSGFVDCVSLVQPKLDIVEAEMRARKIPRPF